MGKERGVIQRLHDIRENLEFIMQTVSSVSSEEFFDDVLYPAAVSRAFEIIGEAAKYVPDNLRDTYPQIPWDELISFGDLLAYEYHKVSVQDVWRMANNHILEQYDEILLMIGSWDKKLEEFSQPHFFKKYHNVCSHEVDDSNF